MCFGKHNRHSLNKANRQRLRDGQTWGCPLASRSGSEWVWESGTSWQRASHQCTQKEKGNMHVYTHQTPLSSHPVSLSLPLSPTLLWGYSPWMKGESWEDLLSCSLEWINSGADSVLLGAARSCKERWMSCWVDCCVLAGDVSPVIDELTQCPLLHWSNRSALTIRPPHCPEEATC